MMGKTTRQHKNDYNKYNQCYLQFLVLTEVTSKAHLYSLIVLLDLCLFNTSKSHSERENLNWQNAYTELSYMGEKQTACSALAY